MDLTSSSSGELERDSGEFYEWDEDGAVGNSSCQEALNPACVKIAVGKMFVCHWPEKNRHEAAQHVGGFLARAGWDMEAIGHFIVAVQQVAGVTNQDHVENGRKAAVDSANHYLESGEGYGLPTLIEFFGENVAKKIAKYVGYSADPERVNAEGFEVYKGRLVNNSQRNIRRALDLLGVTVSYDAFHDYMLITGLEGFHILNDPAMERLWLTVDDKFDFLPTKDFFWTVVGDLARRNSFHPVRDYLAGLQWDGVNRLDTWLVKYGGAKDTAYVRAVGAITLIAAVRRVRQPGCKFDEMLILESPQGTEKSTMLACLAGNPDWFLDDLPLNADSKKIIEQLRGRWIVEAAELSGIHRSAVEHLKAMLSRQVDRARLAWGRLTTDHPRQCIIVGTTNAKIYLKDITGNRRFWPVEVKAFDMLALQRDRDQLWAEAAAREAAGASIRLDPKLWAAAAAEQQERTVHDPWFDVLSDTLGDIKGKLLAADAWTIVGLGKDVGRRTQDHNERLGRAMKELGFTRTVASFDGKNERCYVRGNKAQRQQRIYAVQEKDSGRVFCKLKKADAVADATAAADIM